MTYFRNNGQSVRRETDRSQRGVPNRNESLFGPVSVDTDLEPAVAFNEDVVERLLSEVKGPDSDQTWLKQIVADYASRSPCKLSSLNQVSDHVHAEALRMYDASEKGRRLQEIDKQLPFLNSLAESTQQRLRLAEDDRDLQPVLWTRLNLQWDGKNRLSTCVGICLTAVLALTMWCTLRSEIGNAEFLYEQSGIFDDYLENEAAEKISDFVFVLILGFAVGLKAPFLVLSAAAFRVYKKCLCVAFVLLGFCTVCLFGIKAGDGMEASSTGIGNAWNTAAPSTQSTADIVPNAALPICSLMLAALTLNTLFDFLIYIMRWSFDTTVVRDVRGQKANERVCQLAASAGGEINVAARLSSYASGLTADRERFAGNCVTSVKSLWNELNRDLQSTIKRFPATLLMAVCCIAVGCSSHDGTENQDFPASTNGGTVAVHRTQENSEWFLIVAIGTPQTSLDDIWNELGTLVLDRCVSGDRISVMRGPDLSPVASVVIPEGSRGRRQRDQHVKSGMADLFRFLHPDKSTSDVSAQVNLPMIASAIAASRQTDYRCRVIIVGDPVHIDAQSGWNCDGGYTPNDASMDDPQSPWGNSTRFPSDTQINWLTPTMTWGEGPAHQESLLRYLRLYVQERDGKLCRMTPDPATAFLLFNPQFTDTIVKRDDISGMRFSHIDGRRPDDAPKEKFIEVPVNPVSHETLVATPSKQFEGLSRAELEKILEAGKVDEPVDIIIVIDDSSSMSHAREINNKTLKALGRTLPLLAPALQVSVVAFAGETPSILPFTTISPIKTDSGRSLLVLNHFLENGHTAGGQADMLKALDLASARFSRTGRRQVMMVIGDTAEESLGETSPAKFNERKEQIAGVVSDWIDAEPRLRSFVAVYVAGEGRDDTRTSRFLRELCLSSTRCTYSDDPSNMLDLVLAGIHAR